MLLKVYCLYYLKKIAAFTKYFLNTLTREINQSKKET